MRSYECLPTSHGITISSRHGNRSSTLLFILSFFALLPACFLPLSLFSLSFSLSFVFQLLGERPVYSPQPISWQTFAARCKSLCAGRYNLPFLDRLKRKTASVSKSGKSNWSGHQLPRRAGCNETSFPCTVLTALKVPRELPGGQSAGKVHRPELDYCPSSYTD